MDRDPLTQKVIGCAMMVHSRLGPGFLEAIYHRALEIELKKQGINFESQKPLAVLYDETTIGEFVCDMLIDGKLLIEIKAVQSINPAHEVQIVNYLTALRLETGLLVNFGMARLEFKRKFRTYRPSGEFKFK
jgi:GxxExxY protein